ncbi:prepilin-type N-terminal cleavage/methylation domain-containing protein [Aquabacterium sp. J223]|uniref:type IV pilus modification PilV family protein n=1 Tax=Aquabacterium sp. J223 TaxID=2898431 RepID=UPI0021AD9A98|nr:prepilin-type N-terminal cleavage/methylation domain-containing protein [Aquabacterium sp. J223]UUX96545.1 prepilin-type N-terminal cleavage/methylation domain-containing protein [Aquabacterium sp. J223]
MHGVLRRAPRRAVSAGRGFALIEVLVGLLILAVGVLGLVGTQASMVQAQGAAKYRGDAAYLAAELVGLMWSDLGNLSQYAGDGATPCTATRCLDWARKVASTLPQGQAEVTVNSGTVVITIRWTPPGDAAHAYTTRSALNA